METDFGEGWRGKTGVYNVLNYMIAIKLGPQQTDGLLQSPAVSQSRRHYED